MSREFETPTNRAADIQQRVELFMSTCQRCGRCYKDAGPLDRLKLRGYRFDDLEQERWILRSSTFLEGDASAKDIPLELD